MRTWIGGLFLCLVLGAVFLFPETGPTPVLLTQKLEHTSAQPTQNKIEKVKYTNMLERRPLHFEKNLGQVDSQVKYLTRAPGFSLFLTESGPVISLPSKNGDSRPDIIRMKLIEADPAPEVVAGEKLPGVSNYFQGNEPSKWIRGAETFKEIRYKNVYPGIDWVFYGNPDHLEYDFEISPGADPRQIELKFETGSGTRLNPEGDLILGKTGSNVIQKAPVIYQFIKGARSPVVGNYVITQNETIRFNLEEYDPSLPLVIDPVVLSGIMGGSDSSGVTLVRVDPSGNIWMAGRAFSPGFPLVNPIQSSPKQPFSTAPTALMKLSADGSSILASTFFDGKDSDTIQDIEFNSLGQAILVGFTSSSNFPTFNPIQASPNGGSDIFVAILNSSATSLVFSSYLGGSNHDTAMAASIDSSDNIWVAGFTSSTDFPLQSAFQSTTGGAQDGFLTKLSPSGGSLLFSTYFGASDDDEIWDMDLDSSGNVWVVGRTESSDYPILNANNTSSASASTRAIVTKFNPAVSTLLFSTAIGGDGESNLAKKIQIDSSDQPIVLGSTGKSGFSDVSTNFLPSFLVTPQNYAHGLGFAVKLSNAGNILSATQFGGPKEVSFSVNDFTLNSQNQIVVGGFVESNQLDVVHALQNTTGGGQDGFVSILSADLQKMVFSTYWGGSGQDTVTGIRVDATGRPIWGGETRSQDFPFNPSLGGHYHSQLQGQSNWFLTLLDPDFGIRFQTASSSVQEIGGNATVGVQLKTADSFPATVNYSITGGTATVGSDFTSVSGQLTFNTLNEIKSISIPILNDILPEGNETIELTLSSPVNSDVSTPARHTVTIIDDEGPSIAFFSQSSSNGLETVSNPHIPVLLSAAQGVPVTVDYSVTGGSATGGGVDFSLANGTLTFNPGETSKNIPLIVVNDSSPESGETVVITLSNPVNATLQSPTQHTYGIDDEDTPTVVQFSTSGSSHPENSSPATIPVTLDTPFPLTVTVDYRITGGTATSGQDYTLANGTLTFPANVTTQNISVALIDDSLIENGETIILILENPVNAVTGNQTTHTFSILDDESPSTFSFQSATSSGAESVTSVTVPVSLFPASVNQATLQYSVSSGTASAGSDFTATSGQLQFAAGETSKNITFTVIDDNIFENEESVIITLSSPSGAALGSPSVHTYLIQNNDSASPSLTGPTVVAPYWQTGDGVYSFIAVSHPGLQGMNSQVGVTVSAFLQGGKLLGKSVFTVDEGQTQRVFFIRPNHPAINPLNFPESAYIFTSPSAIGLNTTGGLGFLRMDPVADTPTQPLAGSGGGMPDVRMLAYWGAVVFEGTNTGFALEFIGDLNDSSSHPGMAPGRLPSGVN